MTSPCPSHRKTAKELTSSTDSLNAILSITHILMTHYNRTLLMLPPVVLSCLQCAFFISFYFLKERK
jgi:hypothetical protein